MKLLINLIICILFIYSNGYSQITIEKPLDSKWHLTVDTDTVSDRRDKHKIFEDCVNFRYQFPDSEVKIHPTGETCGGEFTVIADTITLVDTVFVDQSDQFLNPAIIQNVEWTHKHDVESDSVFISVSVESEGSLSFQYRCGNEEIRAITKLKKKEDLLKTDCKQDITLRVSSTYNVDKLTRVHYFHEEIIPNFIPMAGFFTITNDSILWTNTGQDNAYFDLSLAPVDFWNDVSNAGEIRVFFWDGSTETEVAREVILFDKVNQAGVLFFDSSNSVANTQNEWRVKVESGASEPAPSDPNGKYNVWNGYIAVLHMIVQGDGTVGEFEDSSGNGNHGFADTHGTQLPQLISGGAGGLSLSAQRFSGESYIRVPNSATLNDNYGAISISTFINNHSEDAAFGARIVSKALGATGDSWAATIDGGSGGGNSRARVSTSNGTVTAENNQGLLKTINWVQYAFTYGGSNIRIFFEGSEVDLATQTGLFSTDGQDMTIGAHNDPDSRRWYQGDISMVRIRSFAVDAAYFETEKNIFESNSTMWTVGAWQGGGVSVSVSDTIAVEDSTTILGNISQEDSTSIGDDISQSADIQQTDNANLSSEVSNSASLEEQDSMTFVDLISIDSLVSESDQINFSSSLSLLQDISVTDEILVVDQINVIKEILKSVSDSFSISDSLFISASAIIADQFTVEDLLSGTAIIELSDQSQVSDLVNVIKEILKTVNDSISASDELSISNIFSLNDVIELTDSVLGGVSISVSDDLSIEDQINVIKEIIKQVNDSASFSSSLNISSDLSESDSFSISDFVQINTAFSINDSMSLQDQISVLQEALKIVSDSMSLNSEVNVQAQLQGVDSAQIGDAISAINNLSLSDELSIIDTVLAFDSEKSILKVNFTFSKRSFDYSISQRSYKSNFSNRSAKFKFKSNS